MKGKNIKIHHKPFISFPYVLAWFDSAIWGGIAAYEKYVNFFLFGKQKKVEVLYSLLLKVKDALESYSWDAF